jgi:DNA polymerase III alpha subunit
MRVVEKMGLLKMDFLGLRTLTVIDDAVKSAKAVEGIDIVVDSIPLDDPEVFRLFQEGRTKGVFQFESGGMVDLLRKSRPTRFEDLAALNALYRPGALDAGMVDEYVRRKNGQSKARYLVPAMKEILEETYGVIVYQEQVMQIAQQVAAYSLGQADLLRKAMGKKDAAIMAAEREKFVAGAATNDYDKKKANEIFDYIEPFARYGFNKSHSVAYALVAYQTAWLKVHYPRHFLAGLMTSEMDRTDAVVKFIHETAQMGIKILPPDINESNFPFTVVGPNIRFGLGAVKGVGEGAINSILEARQKHGRFTSLLQFCELVDLRACNKKVIEALIKSGSFDFIGRTRRDLFESLESTADSAQRTREEKERGQVSMFEYIGSGGLHLSGSATHSLTSAAGLGGESIGRAKMKPEWPDDEKLRFEKETLGFYITGHPLNKYTEELKLFGDATTETLHQHIDEVVNIGGIVSQIKRSKIKKGPNEGKLMAKFVLDDQFGSVDVVVFSDLYAKYAKWLDNGVAVLLTASVKDTGGVQAGRSAALQSAEQNAHRDDEYGRISAYDVSDDDVEDDRDPKEVEREKYGADVDKYTPSLFGGTQAAPPPAVSKAAAAAASKPGKDVPASAPKAAEAATPLRVVDVDETDAFNEAVSQMDAGDPFNEAVSAIEPSEAPANFAAHAATFHEAPIVPELNALELVLLDGIRDKKVKEISLEVRYEEMTEERIRRIREIVEDNPGDVPLTIMLTDLPPSLGKNEVKLRVDRVFRVQPGPALQTALSGAHVKAQYVFERNTHAA